MAEDPPSYLAGYRNRYHKDPRQAAREWFDNTGFGLFLHWGLYSKYGENCPYLYEHDDVSIPEYKETMEEFEATGFDADVITDLAIDAEMEYVTFVSRHHDSFSLWDTDQSAFKSTNAPAGRDFVAELAERCREKGLGCSCTTRTASTGHTPRSRRRSPGSSVRPSVATATTTGSPATATTTTSSSCTSSSGSF